MKLRLRAVNKKGRQETKTLQNKQQAYHYSSRRSNVERINQRRETQDTVKEQSSKLSLLPTYFALVLILIGVVYVLHLSPNASVESIDDSGQFIGDKSAVESTANEYLKSSIMNRFKLTFDARAMEESLRTQYPEFTNINVSTNLLLQKPIVSIDFATPTLLISSGEKLFLISETGRSIADVSNESSQDIDTAELPLVQDLSGVELAIGDQALTTEQVEYIREINFQTNSKGLRTEKMELMPGGGELRVYYADLGYFVKYNFYEDARQSSGAFLATKEDLESRGVTPTNYVDVRVVERAYIR